MSKLHLVCFALLASAGLAHAESLSKDELYVVKPEGTAETAVHKPGRIPWCDGKYSGEVWDFRRILRSINGYADWQPDTGWERGLEHMCQFADDPLWQRQATYVIQQAMNSDTDKTQDEVVARIKRLIAASQKERANANKEPTDEDRFAFADMHLRPVAAVMDVDTAKITGPIPWCEGIKVKEKWDSGRISRAAENSDNLFQAAFQLCWRPNDVTWKQKAGYLLQTWMNETNLNQTDAIVSLRARMTDQFAAGLREMCDSNEKSAVPMQILAGCGASPMASFTIDRRGTFKTDMARFAWLRKLPSLRSYAIVQREADFDLAKLKTELASGTLAKNIAAYVTLVEAFAMFRWQKRELDRELSQQPDLVAKAKAALAEWERIASEQAVQLRKVAEFEAKLSASPSAVAGCAKQFERTVEGLLQSYGTRDPKSLEKRIAEDPLAALILSRVAICHAIEKAPDANLLAGLAATARPIAGPRSFASYALEAPNPLTHAQFLPALEGVAIKPISITTASVNTEGVVGNVTKTAEGVRIEFKKVTVTEPGILCTDTNKVDRIDDNGTVHYRQHCRDTGKKITRDLTPKPIEVSAHFATALKAGVYAVITDDGTVRVVKSKKEDANAIAFYGYSL